MAKDYYTQKKEKALREKKVFIDSTPYNNYDSIIVLMDGTEIRFRHDQDCYEQVFADLSSLEGTGFSTDKSIDRNTLKIEYVEDYGIRINGYGIACYNIQSGCYDSCIDILVVLYEKQFDTSVYGKCDQN